MHKINVAQKLSLFQDHWSPKIVGELNGQHVKLVKFQGEFVWHHHDSEDELFLVVHGSFPAWTTKTHQARKNPWSSSKANS